MSAPHRPGPALREAHALVREKVPHLEEDRPVHADVATVRGLLDDGSLAAAIRRHTTLE